MWRCRYTATIAVRESTENQPLHSAEESFSTPIREAVDFYSDGQAQRLMALETLLDRCDDNDRRLFSGCFAKARKPCSRSFSYPPRRCVTGKRT